MSQARARRFCRATEIGYGSSRREGRSRAEEADEAGSMDNGATPGDCRREFHVRRIDQRGGRAIWHPAEPLGVASTSSAGDRGRETEEQAGAVRCRAVTRETYILELHD